MLVTTHVLAGAVIGACTRNPVAAYGLGVVSHFVMDAVPHWGSGDDHHEFMRVAVRDGLGGLAALAAIAAWTPSRTRFAVLAGAIGAATPDLDKPFAELTGGAQLWPDAVTDFHHRIQRESPQRMRQELATLAGLALLAAAAIPLSGRGRSATTRPPTRQPN